MGYRAYAFGVMLWAKQTRLGAKGRWTLALALAGLSLLVSPLAVTPQGLGPLTLSRATAGPAPEPAKPESIAVGVQLDAQRGVLLAAGSAAADLFAASAEIARIKAERLARLRAEDRLRKALQFLSRDPKRRASWPQLGKLDVTRATTAHIDYAATGSVSLRLELALQPPPASATKPAVTPPTPPTPPSTTEDPALDGGPAPAAEPGGS
jgi:hypothetical protein